MLCHFDRREPSKSEVNAAEKSLKIIIFNMDRKYIKPIKIYILEISRLHFVPLEMTSGVEWLTRSARNDSLRLYSLLARGVHFVRLSGVRASRSAKDRTG